MKKLAIIGHQGAGDLFSMNSIYNFYFDDFSEGIIFARSTTVKNILEGIYQMKNIQIEIPKLLDWDVECNETCIYCQQNGSVRCPSDLSVKCKTIDYNYYTNKNYTIIKLGAFNNYKMWELFLDNERNLSSSFSHAFYKYEKIPISLRIKSFHIFNNSVNVIQNKFTINTNRKYIVIHDDIERGFGIPFYRILSHSFKKKYRINGVSTNMVDQIRILENANELHFIDSSYSVMIYFLSFHNEKIKSIPKYLHTLCRKDRDYKIYLNPTPLNWHFYEYKKFNMVTFFKIWLRRQINRFLFNVKFCKIK